MLQQILLVFLHLSLNQPRSAFHWQSSFIDFRGFWKCLQIFEQKSRICRNLWFAWFFNCVSNASKLDMSLSKRYLKSHRPYLSFKQVPSLFVKISRFFEFFFRKFGFSRFFWVLISRGLYSNQIFQHIHYAANHIRNWVELLFF